MRDPHNQQLAKELIRLVAVRDDLIVVNILVVFIYSFLSNIRNKVFQNTFVCPFLHSQEVPNLGVSELLHQNMTPQIVVSYTYILSLEYRILKTNTQIHTPTLCYTQGFQYRCEAFSIDGQKGEEFLSFASQASLSVEIHQPYKQKYQYFP